MKYRNMKKNTQKRVITFTFLCNTGKHYFSFESKTIDMKVKNEMFNSPILDKGV